MPQAIDQALKLHQDGRLSEAERLYRDILRSDPRNFTALHLLGVVKLQQDQPQEALDPIRAALAINPNSEVTHSNHGVALAGVGRYQEALESYDRALKLNPRNADALINRGDALCDLGRREEAVASYDQALAVNPAAIPALVNRGLALRELGQVERALASYEGALTIDPRNAETLNNFGVALQDLGRHRDALTSYERAIASRPDYVEALFNRGNALLTLKRPGEALASYAGALALRPHFAEAHCNRGHALADLERFEEALASYEQATAAKLDYVEALVNRAEMLAKLDRHDEAVAAYEVLWARHPENPTVAKNLLNGCAAACRWSKIDELSVKVVKTAVEGQSAIDPFLLMGLDTSAAQQLAAAKNWMRLKNISTQVRSWDATSFPAGRLKIAYLSADFHRHATAHLIAELLELHDRQRVEIIGISFGPDDRSDLRSRLIKSFDRFFDVSSRTDEEVVALIRDHGVQIAVDLKGHTQNSRIGILAQRCAPVQVSYLGYPGSTGADFIDYAIADEFVLPFDQAPFYTEKIVHLPDSYQVNDRKRLIAPKPDRAELGLPAGGLVFCCFNNSWKLNRRMFEVWMRLLAAVDDGVLWLLKQNSAVTGNLRKEASNHGVDPARLIFAAPADLPDHLARLALADLFLDTLPYNAHTTASDALWMGVPVVTCTGSTFAGRVATSLVHAAGLSDLATPTVEAYESLALKLAADREALRAIRARLEARRLTCPLFDTDRFRRHLEAAYTTMWDRWLRGEQPRSFAVDPVDVRQPSICMD